MKHRPIAQKRSDNCNENEKAETKKIRNRNSEEKSPVCMLHFAAEVSAGCDCLMAQLMEYWLRSFQLRRVGYGTSFIDRFD